LLPENLCRNELDWASVGLHKAEGVKEALSVVAPGIEVKVRLSRLAGQESGSSASSALDMLAACDVVVDATANSAVFVLLAAMCKRRRRKLVWGEVFAGGIGGLIARSRPGKDPDPLTIRERIHAYLETREPAPFRAAGIGYDVEGDDRAPLIASDAEISQFAAMATRFALDAALEPEPSEFPQSAYLIGFKRAWIFSAPFDTQPISLAHAPSTETDISGERKQALEDTLNFLGKLVGPSNNAQARPPK
jgi:hypothetical protein